jgi:hypothetical protein
MTLQGLKTALLGTVILGAISSASSAEGIEYELTGTGTGSLGGINGIIFIDETFEIISIGTLSNIGAYSSGAYTNYDNFPVTMTVYITGIGTLPVTDTSYVFASGDGYAGFGADPHGDLVEIYGQPFISTYDLDTDVSPISVTGQAVGGIGDETTGGELAFYDVGDAVFSAVTGVPEPGAWVMMLLGLGGVGAVARTLRKRRVVQDGELAGEGPGIAP